MQRSQNAAGQDVVEVICGLVFGAGEAKAQSEDGSQTKFDPLLKSW